jgi:hypothetical protein
MAQKWIVREGSKTKGFRYKVERQRDKERLRAGVRRAADSPAWRDVHVSTNAAARFRTDARGRKRTIIVAPSRRVSCGNTIVLDRWRAICRPFAPGFSDFRKPGLSKQKVCAGIVR